MPFIIHQWENVVGLKEPHKNHTRRPFKKGQVEVAGDNGIVAVYENGREKWRVGKTYALVPRMGKPAIWEHADGRFMADTIQYRPSFSLYHSEVDYENLIRVDSREFYRDNGWQEARIEVVSIHLEKLHDLDDEDAFAEGVTDREAYKALWISLYGRQSWKNNPSVWDVEFRYQYGIGR